MWRLLWVWAVLSAAVGSARADFEQPGPGEVAVRPLSIGGRIRGEEARAIIDAPPPVVRRWLTEYEYWPGRFRDVRATRVLGRNGASTRLWVRSRLMRELVLEVRETNEGVVWEANDARVRAQAQIRVVGRPDGRTDVTMATAAELRGLLGVITPRSLIRRHEREKLVSDLSDLQRLARGRAPGREPAKAASGY